MGTSRPSSRTPSTSSTGLKKAINLWNSVAVTSAQQLQLPPICQVQQRHSPDLQGSWRGHGEALDGGHERCSLGGSSQQRIPGWLISGRWLNNKLPRVSRSSLNAESQACSAAMDALEYLWIFLQLFVCYISTCPSVGTFWQLRQLLSRSALCLRSTMGWRVQLLQQPQFSLACPPCGNSSIATFGCPPSGSYSNNSYIRRAP